MDKIEYFGEIMFASKGVNGIEEACLLGNQTRVTRSSGRKERGNVEAGGKLSD